MTPDEDFGRRRGLLDARVAIVTGGGGGIGRASAEMMAAEGASVAVADRDARTAGEVAATIKVAGGRAIAVTVDVTEEASVASMVATVLERFGRVDVLQNCAARDNSSHDDGDALTITTEAWDDTLAVNLRGTLWCCRHAIRAMLETGGGSIVNLSSTASLGGAMARVAYSASKAGVNALTEHVATAFGPSGIRCNAILPGPVLTQQMLDVLSADYRRALEASIPTPGGMPEPADVARVACFLASDQTRFVNGALVRLDGGMMCHQPTYADLRRLATDW